MRSHYNRHVLVSQKFMNVNADVSHVERFSAKFYINMFTLCILRFVFKYKTHM